MALQHHALLFPASYALVMHACVRALCLTLQ